MSEKELQVTEIIQDDLKGIILNVQEELTEDQKLIVKRYLRKIDILPMNVLMAKFKPSLWFGIIGAGWGISSMCMAFPKSGTTIVVLRALVGLFEAGFVPGIVSFLSYWYTRSEVSFRMSMIFTAVPIAGAIGYPFSAALSSGKIGPFLPYQSIFFFQGIITVAIALFTAIFLINYPDHSKIFTPEEKALLLKRLNTEQGMASKTKPTIKQTLVALSDWKMYLFALLYFGAICMSTIVGTFGPTIFAANGYKSKTAIYLSAIPSVSGLVGIFITSQLLNRIKYSTLVLVYAVFSVSFFAACMYSKNKVLKVVFLSFTGITSASTVPIVMAWISTNTGGIYKGIVSSAIVISIGSIAGAVASRFFVPGYGPKFTTGTIFNVVASCVTIVLTIFFRFYFIAENKRRDNSTFDINHIPIEDQRLLYDKHPNFRYRP
ncbi:hypothetical protein BB560_004950 [Smittium megazygosporum]|uniref:Major facilitator superfamily (MFS) profile domain-containing protein n=1 Tax=Smittium megazygosporum TaxID=133381 RepID=A0A2T9Z800_9FUNG|nr:hypothetical protein BB560_004950 [Smittium megazygosporum]